VRIKATGHLLKGMTADAGLMGEMKARFGDVADLAASVEKIVKSGCNSFNEVANVYATLHGKPKTN
jgi:hypothetical protein